MKAYQITQWGAPLEAREIDIPTPKGTEVLIKVTACGVCHSDIHIWDGFFDMGGGRKVTLEDRVPERTSREDFISFHFNTTIVKHL